MFASVGLMAIRPSRRPCGSIYSRLTSIGVSGSDEGVLPRPALPRRPDRRPAPARTKTAAIVTATDEAGPAEIVQLAVIAKILRGIVRLTRDGALPAVDRDGIVRRL